MSGKSGKSGKGMVNGLVRWMLPIALVAATGCGAVATPLAANSTAALRAADRTPAVGTENFKKVNDKVFRGGLPTAEQFVALKKLGVRTDVSLMGAIPTDRKLVAQERQDAEKAGLKFVNLPVAFREPTGEFVDKFLDLVQDPANGPVYVHCAHGRDRTGTMIAAYRIAVDGYSGREALDEMLTFGFKPQKYPFFADFVLRFKAS